MAEGRRRRRAGAGDAKPAILPAHAGVMITGHGAEREKRERPRRSAGRP